MISYIKEVAKKNGVRQEIPIHVLVETHGALKDAFEISALPWMQVLDFRFDGFCLRSSRGDPRFGYALAGPVRACPRRPSEGDRLRGGPRQRNRARP